MWPGKWSSLVIKTGVLPAHALAGDREKARKAGVDDYDIKPVELKRLLAKNNAFFDFSMESDKLEYGQIAVIRLKIAANFLTV